MTGAGGGLKWCHSRREKSCFVVWWYSRGYLCIISQTAADRRVPIMFWAVLITLCRDFLSWSLHQLGQFVMFPIPFLSP